MAIVLWIIQGILALVFLLAGLMKGFTPLEGLKKNMAWVRVAPAAFVRFVGIAELLGALGLILPILTGIQPWLTIAAALGLVVVMLGAIIFHSTRKEYSQVGLNVVLLLLAVFIAVGHIVWVPVA